MVRNGETYQHKVERLLAEKEREDKIYNQKMMGRFKTAALITFPLVGVTAYLYYATMHNADMADGRIFYIMPLLLALSVCGICYCLICLGYLKPKPMSRLNMLFTIFSLGNIFIGGSSSNSFRGGGGSFGGGGSSGSW